MMFDNLKKFTKFVTKFCRDVEVGKVQIDFHFSLFKLVSFRMLPKDSCKSDRSRQELTKEHWVGRFGCDTAENESSPVCQE